MTHSRRAAVAHVREVLGSEQVSERRVCQVIGQPRSMQRRERTVPDDEAVPVARMIELDGQYGRYGYRRITALLQGEGYRVNHKRVQRLWCREGLKVPSKQPKRGWLWFDDGACVRLRPLYTDHAWSYDFMADRARDGRAFRILREDDRAGRGSQPCGAGSVAAV